MRTALGWRAIASVALGGCAGRDNIQTMQATDGYAACAQSQAEIQANNISIQEFTKEQGPKVAQNVVLGVASLFEWPLRFAMDFKGGTARKDLAALQAGQRYLRGVATEQSGRPTLASATTSTGRGLVEPSLGRR